MNRTGIEWTEYTWNPVTGCSSVSEGCKNCYARRMAKRLAGRHGYPESPHEFDVTLHPGRLGQPLKWKKQRMIFVCSMSDLFHEDVPDEFIIEVFVKMGEAQQHVYQVLTKRPERMLEFVVRSTWGASPLRNVWLGVTAENQKAADERIPILLQTPAAVRFISAEPLLGEICLDGYLGDLIQLSDFDNHVGDGLNLVIVGGETGHGARPMHPDWARELRDQCQVANIPFFFKSWGQFVPESHWRQLTMKQRNRKGAVYSFQDKRFPLDQRMYSVGKKAAGRLLDGVEHNAMPVLLHGQ